MTTSSGTGRGAHVVLVNPPALRGRTNERTYSGGIGVSRKLKPFERDGIEVLPIDFLYLAAVVERAGGRVSFADLLLDRLQGDAALAYCLERVGAPGPDTWVGVRLSMPSLAEDLEFANRLKAALPAGRVFLFGNVIMATVDHWIDRARVDLVLFGEPEAFFEDVLAADEPAAVPGVIDPATYRPLAPAERFDPLKVSERMERWVKVKDLSALPRPAWHLLDMERYAARGGLAEVPVFVQASRGCPIACNMCPYVLLEGRTWRKNDIERVVEEIAFLNERYGIYRMRFRDPNFGFNRRYAHELAEALVARGVKLSATIETSVEVFDEETLRLLHRAGITTITTGVETNDAECMKSIGQRIVVNEKLRERTDLCHAIGFHVYGTYCLGAPEENWDTVERTWRFANELDVESGFTVLTPFPGTPMYWRALEEGLLPRRMQFGAWNSYSATVRTYALTTRDLDMARWWARMETILPYRWKRTRGPARRLAFLVRHLPHLGWLLACRAYVAWRRRFPGPRATPPTPGGPATIAGAAASTELA